VASHGGLEKSKKRKKSGCDQRLTTGRRISFIGILHGHADDRAGLQIDRMLGFVRDACGRPSSW
jgi:hypothetical protein